MIGKDHSFVLIHSPLVGPLTWSRVADEMRRRGFDAVIPVLSDAPDSREPFWQQHAASVAEALADIAKETVLTLVAHSGSGALLPAIRQAIVHPIRAYVFVDAGLPQNGASRLDLMKLEDPEWAVQFQEELEQGGRFPTWTADDLQEVIPEEALRRQMAAEVHPRDLSFFLEPIPVFEGWPDAPCVYIQFSAFYAQPAAQARRAGWRVDQLDAGHFHMLVDPGAVTELIIDAVAKQS